MSELTDRRTAWDAKEAIRAEFFQENDLYGPDVAAISSHQREGDVILLAEGIASGDGWNASTTNRPVDAGMVAEAEALAAAS